MRNSTTSPLVISLALFACQLPAPAQQSMSSATIIASCSIAEPSVARPASASVRALAELGGVTSGTLASPTVRAVFDVLCVAQGNCLTTLCGDCNGDGLVSILDALTAAQHAVAVLSLMGAQFDNCDIDSDGDVDVLDALLVAQVAAGLPVTLTCC